MGSYGSQSVEAIGNLMGYEAMLQAQKKEQPAPYRMPDEQVVTVIMPVGLIRKMTGDWKSLLHGETVAVRSAMRHALWDQYDVKSGLQESEMVDLRKDLPA
jgi:hypothetical protein